MSKATVWDVTLRPSMRQDLDDLIELEALSFDDHYTASILETVRRNQSQLVAELNGDVLGYVSYKRQIDALDRDSFCIYRLAVHPSSRRRGIGWRLVQRLIDTTMSLGIELQLATVDDAIPIGSSCFLQAMNFHVHRGAGSIVIYQYHDLGKQDD